MPGEPPTRRWRAQEVQDAREPTRNQDEMMVGADQASGSPSGRLRRRGGSCSCRAGGSASRGGRAGGGAGPWGAVLGRSGSGGAVLGGERVPGRPCWGGAGPRVLLSHTRAEMLRNDLPS